ncbi:MAG: fumarylacetoacetate hydrolase family protein [Bdellovibrionota bacterium]
MKLGTIKNGTRDGQLVVISKDNSHYLEASQVAPSLQSALDRWTECEKDLYTLYNKLESDLSLGKPVKEDLFHAPLPRAYEWIDGSAYINHVVLVRKARGAEPPESLRYDPLIYQGGSGVLLDPTADLRLDDQAWGLDFEAEVCVIMGDTPQGTKKEDAHKYIRLILIANDVSLRGLIPEELKKGFGFFNSKPATAFSPFAVTPEFLGEAWKEGRVHLPLLSIYNGEKFGDPEAGPEMHFSFYELIEHITKTRALTAGTIIGSGTVSNEDRSKGSSCLAEKRMIEKIDTGEIKTPFMKPGDKITIELFDKNGQSIFGKINQKVVKGPKAP